MNNLIRDPRTGMLIPPFGSNSLNASALFNGRKYYKEAIIVDNMSADFFDLNQYYGRVKGSDSIIPNEEYILTSEGVTSFDFVVKAWNDFMKHMQTNYNRLEQKSKYVNMKAKLSYMNPKQAYRNYIKIFSDLFISQAKKIISLDDFIDQFNKFLLRGEINEPLNFSSFVLSSKYPVYSTGLVIGIVEGDASVDSKKYSDWLSDPNFNLIREEAFKFGFTIDKNAPWNFVFNLDSSMLAKYSTESKQELIDNRYNLAYYSDKELMDEGYWRCYNEWKKKDKKACLPNMNPESLAKEREKTFIDQYIKLLAKENNKKISSKQLIALKNSFKSPLDNPLNLWYIHSRVRAL